MSDPVSNADIEDVLSSIRRLVSVDERADPRKEDAFDELPEQPQAQANDDVAGDEPKEMDDVAPRPDARLVLTPSFRVNPQQESDVAETFDDTSSTVDEGLTLGQWQVAADETVVADERQQRPGGAVTDYKWEEDGASDAEETRDAEGHVFFQHKAELDSALVDDALMRPEGERAEGEMQLNEWHAADDQHDEAQESGLSDEHHDDDTSDLIAAQDEKLEVQASLVGEDTGFDHADLSEQETEDECGEVEVDAAPVASELEARIAEVEAAVAAREEQWEPDGASEDEYAGGQTEPVPWQDHAEKITPVFVSSAMRNSETDADVDGAPVSAFADETLEHAEVSDQSEAVVTPKAESTDQAYDGMGASDDAEKANDTAAKPTESEDPKNTWYREDADAFLDEEALRDLVSEIVRQELQGTLGERITRNVRKLVRREIHRALMGQDFD